MWLGMCNISLKLALFQSLVVLLEIYKIKILGNLDFAVISPIFSKCCEQSCMLELNVHFICGRFLNQHNNSTLQINLNFFCILLFCYSVLVLTFYL